MSLSEGECRGLRRRRKEVVTRLFCDQCHIFCSDAAWGAERCGVHSANAGSHSCCDGLRKILQQSPCKYLKITPCKVINQLRRLPQARRRFLPATPLDKPGLCFGWTFVCGLWTWIKCWSSFIKQQSGRVFFLFCSVLIGTMLKSKITRVSSDNICRFTDLGPSLGTWLGSSEAAYRVHAPPLPRKEFSDVTNWSSWPLMCMESLRREVMDAHTSIFN